jgi:hypothetical protein
MNNTIEWEFKTPQASQNQNYLRDASIKSCKNNIYGYFHSEWGNLIKFGMSYNEIPEKEKKESRLKAFLKRLLLAYTDKTPKYKYRVKQIIVYEFLHLDGQYFE